MGFSLPSSNIPLFPSFLDLWKRSSGGVLWVLCMLNSEQDGMASRQNFLTCQDVGITGTQKSIHKGSPGLKNPEFMEMLGFGPSHNKTKILLDQNWSE